MEEAAPVAVSAASMRLPGEVFKSKDEGAPQADGEKTRWVVIRDAGRATTTTYRPVAYHALPPRSRAMPLPTPPTSPRSLLCPTLPHTPSLTLITSSACMHAGRTASASVRSASAPASPKPRARTRRSAPRPSPRAGPLPCLAASRTMPRCWRRRASALGCCRETSRAAGGRSSGRARRCSSGCRSSRSRRRLVRGQLGQGEGGAGKREGRRGMVAVCTPSGAGEGWCMGRGKGEGGSMGLHQAGDREGRGCWRRRRGRVAGVLHCEGWCVGRVVAGPGGETWPPTHWPGFPP